MGPLSMIVDAVRSLGPSTALAAPVYSWRRARLERLVKPGRAGGSAKPGRAGWTGPGQVLRVESTDRGATFVFEWARLDALFLAEDLIRLAWSRPGAGGVAGDDSAAAGHPPLPYALAKEEAAWPWVPVWLEEGFEGWTLTSTRSELRVERATGIISLLDHAGRLLRRETPPAWSGSEVRHTAVLAEGEKLHGLGEKAVPLDLRGRTYALWNRDPGGAYGPGNDPLYVNIPVYIGIHRNGSYLTFFENPWRAEFDLGASAPDRAVHRFDGGGLVYYLIPGPVDRAIERYTELTGRPPMPPLWALGYHQSRWSYYPEERVRRLAEDFGRHDVPVDVIHLDIDYMRGFRVFTWDPERFPDPARLTADLLAIGIRLVTIIDPGVKRDRKYPLYRQGLDEGVFCRLPDGRPAEAPVWPGYAAFPDFTSPKAREWWGSQYAGFLEAGVAGFWHDMNEPSAFGLWGDRTLPSVAGHDLEGRGGDHREAHNLYGLLMCRAGFEGLRRLAPGRRPFIVSRSGWAGIQRYSWNWTGDVTSDWASLKQVVPMVLGLGLSGQPFSGSDVGGFSGRTTPELFTRWLQAAAFTPFFRAHTQKVTPDQEPWSFGEPYLSINREVIKLRYALLPYIYTAAWQACSRGWPIVRPIYWPAPGDGEGGGRAAPGQAAPGEASLGPPDEFLFGDNLLVAPVLDEGSVGRTVILPPGDWYDYWEDRVVTGQVTAAAPLERIPLYVRAGSVLPTEPPARSTAKRDLDRLILHLYAPTGDGRRISLLYTDAGDGYGPSRVDSFFLTRVGSRLTLARVSVGEFPWPYKRIELVPHGFAIPGPSPVIVEGLFDPMEFDLD